MSEWIKVEDELPPLGKYVLGRYNRGNWRSSKDQDGVVCVVVIRQLDESGHNPNNRRDYEWDTFGPSKFFGQDISHWAKLPDPPEK